MKWPDKGKREDFEISGFIKSYARLPEARQFEVVSKGEMPDYTVKDVKTGEEFGIELTSVYIDDRSVPDVHIRDEEEPVEIPYDRGELEQYTNRIIVAIIDKICKARKGYNATRPLILAFYVNEYISIYLGKPELKELVRRYKGVLDSVSPFAEIVFWNLGNREVFRIRVK
jgi:hypothetical protein